MFFPFVNPIISQSSGPVNLLAWTLILYWAGPPRELGDLVLLLFFFHITSALPDQGTQLRWQNSTYKEGRQRLALC